MFRHLSTQHFKCSFCELICQKQNENIRKKWNKAECTTNKTVICLFHKICDFLYFLTQFCTLFLFLVKAYVPLSITPVDGTTPATPPTAGDGKWQTSPQYLGWIIPQEVHRVNINLLSRSTRVIALLMINLKRNCQLFTCVIKILDQITRSFM